MRTLCIAAISFLLLLTASCDQGGDKKPTKAAATSKATAAATAKPTTKAAAKDDGAELDDEDIPVAADFEDKAEKEISEDNLEDKLAELEKELSSDT
ncbi:MAG: hypothetical protein JRI23_18300 [Deltaproteobacteria bacterium]|jgi:type III secretory pathway component EscV|nr:hypothetical protein [Deltaproteobacteria bacterium]MBW2533810.1 hypothetical protein [Deltaproteobacteria bacterium]